MRVLWFSGGKDSMACLYLLKDELHDITVLWANTGKNYPEALDTIERAKTMCQHWIEIKTDREGQWAANGVPSDMVPIDWTRQGQVISGAKPVMVQSYLGCCYENITGPLWAESKRLGATEIIKGQRADESHKSAAKDGDVIEGIRFSHPIENWTRDQVLDYLKREMGELPGYYTIEHSSLDCYDCTAYVAHSHDRIQWTRDRHPDLYQKYATSMNLLKSAVLPFFAELEA